MPKEQPKTDRGHVAYTRTSSSGTVSLIKEKVGPKKKKLPKKKTARFQIGDEVYYKRPGEDQRTKRGTIKQKTRTGWVILGRPDGKVFAESKREVFVPDLHVQSKRQYEAKKAPKGTHETTGTAKRTISVKESNRRAKVAAKRFPLSEEQVVTHPKFQAMMAATVTSLATKNKIPFGPTEMRDGIKWRQDSLEYNDLVSDYIASASNALRRELASASKPDIDAFYAQLQGEETGSRIFATITTEGRTAVMRQMKERAARAKDTEEYIENPEDAGTRRRMAQTASDDEPEIGDDGFHFDFDEQDRPHLWGQQAAYNPADGDPYERMRYREAVIEHFVGKLPAGQREVIERKYALGSHLDEQTNSDIAAALKKLKIAYPAPGKEWNRQTVTPVHNEAINALRNMDSIDMLRQEYERDVRPRLKKSLTPLDFFKALREHIEMVKSIGPCRTIAPGIILRRRSGKDIITFDPKRIVTAGFADFAKSYSSDLAKKFPGGRWITVKESGSPLRGRHIFILPHKDGTATVLAGGGPAMRHKTLQPKEDQGKKPEAEGSGKPSAKPEEKKPQISEERRTEIETARTQHREQIKDEKKKIADIVRTHLGTEVELTEKDRAKIEKKVEAIADPKEQAATRLRETLTLKKEKDDTLKKILQQAKEVVIDENPVAADDGQEKQPTIAAVVKAHAEDLLHHHYKIEALKREDRELRRLLKVGNEKKAISDRIEFEPLSKEDLKKIILDEDMRDKEMAAHYKLAATVRGYVDEKGQEHKAKGGQGVERNLLQGGYEAVTGIVGELTGNSILEKRIYDELGPRNAAVLAHYYLKNSGMDSKKLGEHLTEDLGKIGSQIAERAVRKGDDFMAMAEKVKQTGYGEASLMEAAQARGAALKYINKAYETYAQAQGALNQAAELAYDAASDSGRVELAAASMSTLEAKRKRLGLKASDVKIERDGSAYKMAIKPTAFEKLISEYATPKTGGVAGEGYSLDDIKAHRANTDDFSAKGLRDYTPPDRNGVSHKIDLSPSQQAAVRFIEKQKRVYLNYEAGTGKSLSVIAAKAHVEQQSGKQQKMIVSMPSPIMKNFADEVTKFSDFKVAIIEPNDTPEQRKAKYNSPPDTIVVVNHEKMNFDQADISKAGFNMVVADEAHTVTQREGGKRSYKSEGLKNVARQADHYVAMSGTPTPNDLSELYFHANLMNPERFSSQKEFMARFGSVHKGEGMKEKIAAFMNKELSDHIITAKKGTMLKPDGTPIELRMKTHFAPLSEKQRQDYRETVAAVKSGEISQLQAENRMKGILNDTHHGENGKFNNIKSIIDNHLKTKGDTEKISIYTHSYAGADNLHEFLEKHYPDAGVVRFANRDRKKAGESQGRNYRKAEKDGFKEEFKHNPKVRFAIHTTAGTTGLNLQHDGNGGGATTVIAVASGEAGYSSIDQFFSRANRKGANRDIDAHMVLTDTPYDLGTKLRLDEKKAVQDMLRSMPQDAMLLRKARVKAHTRKTKSGAVAQVREHQDRRQTSRADAEAIQQGVRPVLVRGQNARDRFVESAVEQFGITEKQARMALEFYLDKKNKLATIDYNVGQVKMKHGQFWDKKLLLRAAKLQAEKG